jgi:hypothetical protein
VTLSAPGAPAAPTVTASGPLTFCEGSAVTLTSSNGDYYTWSNGEITQSITVSTAGTYNVVITDLNGCSSPASLDVTVNVDPMPDLNVSVANNVLTADQAGASYQWVDCNNGNAPIAGATSQSFTPTANGSYACEITMGSCVGMSNCSTINTIGLDEHKNHVMTIYPNPTKSILHMQTDAGMVNGTIYTTSGMTVLQFSGKQVDVSSLAPGVYFVSVETENGNANVRFVKE